MNIKLKECQTNDALAEYILSTGNRLSQEKINLLKETRNTFPKASIMSTDPVEGELLKMLVQLTGSKRGIEIGVFTGYSSLCFAEALPEDGKLLALDINEEFTNIARKHWKLNKVDHKIELILGNAAETLQNLVNEPLNLYSFDFVYIDADKTNYDIYYEFALRLLKQNGFIIFDNTIWSGDVANEEKQDPSTIALRQLNLKLNKDERVSICMLNIADGVTIVRKL